MTQKDVSVVAVSIAVGLISGAAIVCLDKFLATDTVIGETEIVERLAFDYDEYQYKVSNGTWHFHTKPLSVGAKLKIVETYYPILHSRVRGIK